MISLPILWDELRSRRGFILGLTVLMALMTLMYLAIYPSFEEQVSAFTEDLPEAMRALVGDADFGTPEGYIQAEVFSLTSPLLFAAMAISLGSGLARGERNFTLVPVFFSPVSRRRLAASYAATVLAIAALAGAVMTVVLLIGAPLANAELGIADLLAGTIHLAALVATAGSISFLVSATTGNPSMATLAGWLLVGVSFVANSIAGLVDGLEWLRSVNPWGWYGAGASLLDGIDWVGLSALVAVSVAAFTAGIAAFERRDLQL